MWGMLWHLLSYLHITEAVKVEIGGGEQSLQGIAENSKLVKHHVFLVKATTWEDPDNGHGQVCQQEREI